MRTIHYAITPVDPLAHLFEVQCTVEDPDAAGQSYRLPAWIPGSYLIREFARQFIDVRAHANGVAVAIRKESKDLWRADPVDGPLTVVTKIYAFDLSVRTAYLDRLRAYFNGPSVFLCPVGHEQAPCTLEIVPPPVGDYAAWRVATTLDRDGAPPHGFGRYRAQNYDALIDHPVEISDFALAAFAAGGARHEITVTGRHDADLERLARDLSRVCQWHVDLFGGVPGSPVPFDRYLFQVTAVGKGYGGLEHRSSASLLCRRDELPASGSGDGISDDYLHFLGLASHEYFHAWNVKRIKPSAFDSYDLARETYTRQLWAFEGLTSYYDDLALVRCGLIDATRYLEVLGRGVTRVLRVPGRHLQSLAESSFDAWIKFYRPDENSPNAVVSYYTKGALVALALDLTLRASRKCSLDDVMRALWERHGTTGRGVPEGGVEAIAGEIAGTDLREFFDRYVHGTEDPPLASLLDAFGVEWATRASIGRNDLGGKPANAPLPASWFGATIGPDLALEHVYTGGPAERAGLAPRDVLVAIDGVRASPEALGALVLRRAPGQVVPMHAFRRDELHGFDVEMAAPPADTCHLSLRTDAPAAALALRHAWLNDA